MPNLEAGLPAEDAALVDGVADATNDDSATGNDSGAVNDSDVSDGGAGIPQALSTSPVAGASDVERRPTLSVEFAPAPAADSVDSSTVTLECNAEPIDGEVSLSAGEVSFVPTRRLPLLAHCTLRLSGDISGADGTPIVPLEVDFTVRDGSFQAADTLSTSLSALANLSLAIEEDGHMLAAWDKDGDAQNEAYASVYRAEADWSDASPLDSGPSFLPVALANRGHIAAVWGTTLGSGPYTHRTNQSRYDLEDASWGAVERQDFEASITSIERRTAAMNGSGQILSVVQTENAAPNIWGVVHDSGTGWGTPLPFSSVVFSSLTGLAAIDDSTFVAGFWSLEIDEAEQLHARIFDGNWDTIATLNTNALASSSPFALAAGGGLAVQVFAQVDDANQALWANVLPSVAGSWQPPVEIAGNLAALTTIDVTVNATGKAIVAWTNDAVISARRYDPATQAVSAAVPLSGSLAGDAPCVLLDTAGNALVIWKTSGGLAKARGLSDGSWQAATALKTNGAVQDFACAIGADGDAGVLFTQAGASDTLRVLRFE